MRANRFHKYGLLTLPRSALTVAIACAAAESSRAGPAFDDLEAGPKEVLVGRDRKPPRPRHLYILQTSQRWVIAPVAVLSDIG